MSKKKPAHKAAAKPASTMTARGKWEATLLNIRALKGRVTKLENRVKALENPVPIPPPPVV